LFGRVKTAHLFPSALSEFFSELDCFQALGIKRYTLGGFVTATVSSDSVSVDATGFLPRARSTVSPAGHQRIAACAEYVVNFHRKEKEQ
jgi:hypothetical protein